VVPGDHAAGGVRPDPVGGAAAGAGDGERLCPLAGRPAHPSRAAEDLFAGWWQLLAQLGGVPRVLVWDGEGAIGQGRRRVTVLTEAAHAFPGVLGAKIWICDPGDPEAKGLVERANGYLETSFLPGRSFGSPADFNAQLADWLMLVNQRPRRVLGCAPADRIEADRAGMLPCRRSRRPPVGQRPAAAA
jgi:hypothetical protein